MTIHVRVLRGLRDEVQPEYLSPAGVAAYLKVNRRTVYTWIKQGYLPAVKAGPKLWAVALTDLQNFLRPGAVPKVPSPASGSVVYGGSFGPSPVPGRIPPAQLSAPKPAKKGRKR